MPRGACTLVLVIAGLPVVAQPVFAQTTTTYHLHDEASTTLGFLQLKTQGPDRSRVALRTDNLRGQPAGAATIRSFDTQANVPNLGGFIPAHATVSLTLWMRKTTGAGEVFPQATVLLNAPATATLCTATGATPLTTKLQAFTLSCTTGAAPIAMTTTDRLVVAAGYSMTQGPGKKRLRVQLDVEGKPDRRADSRLVAPDPVPPSLSTVSPSSGRVGASVIVTGTSFGSQQGVSTVSFNGTMAAVTSWTDTRIAVPVPARAGSGPVVVTVGGVPSNGVPFVVIPPPTLTSLTPASGHVGDSVSIAGTDFDATQGSSTVLFDGTLATPASWSDTSIGVPVPAGATSGPVVVTVSGAASNGLAFTVVRPAPSLLSLTPSTGRIGDTITIVGGDFGADQGSSTVTFNGTLATPTSWSDASIAAAVPAGATSGPVVVSVDGQPSNELPFTVDSGASLLEITAPPDGTVVNPGQSLSVTVTSPANVPFSAVGLGGDEIGIVDLGDTLPAQVSIPVPADAACRPHALNAIGRTASGQEASATVLIDVERPDKPLSISVSLPQLIFEVQGPFVPIGVLARFADGSLCDVTGSSNLGYSSLDPSVASVDAHGIVTALAAGRTSVTAAYGAPTDNLAVQIPVIVPPPPFTMTPSSLDFGEQAVGTSAAQPFTLTYGGASSLSVLSVTATGDFAADDDCVSSSPLAGGAACTITVTFAPTAAGPRTGTVLVENSFNSVAVAFRLKGTGVGQ